MNNEPDFMELDEPEQAPKKIGASELNNLNMCKCISGESVLREFNDPDMNSDGLDLATYINIAIDMAMEEASVNQLNKCVDAIRSCELVTKNVRHIHLDEAVGACFTAKLYT